MSAFIAVAFEDRVELLTDGAICDDETGNLIAVTRKVWHSDKVPIAVTGRGDTVGVDSLSAAIIVAAEGLGGFDPAMTWLSEMLADRKAIGSKAAVEIVIVGIAESRGPVVLYFSTAEGQVLDEMPIAPFVLINMEGDAAAGGQPDIDPALMDGLAFVIAGSMAMDAMRKTLTDSIFQPRLEGRYSVGGIIDHTVVSAHGVDIEQVHVWPDVIGEPINPFLDRSLAANEPKYAAGG